MLRKELLPSTDVAEDPPRLWNTASRRLLEAHSDRERCMSILLVVPSCNRELQWLATLGQGTIDQHVTFAVMVAKIALLRLCRVPVHLVNTRHTSELLVKSFCTPRTISTQLHEASARPGAVLEALILPSRTLTIFMAGRAWPWFVFEQPCKCNLHQPLRHDRAAV